jgi:hypothetical protein
MESGGIDPHFCILRIRWSEWSAPREEPPVSTGQETERVSEPVRTLLSPGRLEPRFLGRPAPSLYHLSYLGSTVEQIQVQGVKRLVHEADHSRTSH